MNNTLDNKICIILPAFNEEENIELFIKSFNEIFKNHQDYKFSILFADNASTDKSRQILNKICNEDKNVQYLELIQQMQQMHQETQEL